MSIAAESVEPSGNAHAEATIKTLNPNDVIAGFSAPSTTSVPGPTPEVANALAASASANQEPTTLPAPHAVVPTEPVPTTIAQHPIPTSMASITTTRPFKSTTVKRPRRAWIAKQRRPKAATAR